MSTSLLDSACDAHASIAISSPIKGLSSVSLEPKEIDYTKDAGIVQPSVEDSASLSPLKASSTADIPNEALIHKLLESLEALKTQDGRTDSGTVSPSPLTISTGGSADPIPSSPTGMYEFSSPVGPLTREHSTDSLAAAVQHLSLSQHRRHSAAAVAGPGVLQNTPQSHSNITLAGFGTPLSGTAQASNTTWNAPVATTAATAPAAGAPQTPLQLPSFQIPPQTQQAQHVGLFSTSAATSASSAGGLTLGAAGVVQNAHANAYNAHSNFNYPNASSVLATQPTPAQIAAYQAQMYSTDPVVRAQAQLQLFRMLSPPPAPLYEECLVGIDGAYQSYCHQVINNEINVAALRMLSHVKAAQLTDPPAVTRLIGKRYFCSLKEVSKVVAASSMLLIAPDVRPSITAHIRPVKLLQMVMAAADAAGVPYVFCLSRRGIGQVFGRDKSMSIVAVMHVDGVENEYVTLLEHAALGRKLYAMHRGHGQNNNNYNNSVHRNNNSINNFSNFSNSNYSNHSGNGVSGIGALGGGASVLGSGGGGGYSQYTNGFNSYGQQQQQQQQPQQHHYDSYGGPQLPQQQIPQYSPHGYQGQY